MKKLFLFLAMSCLALLLVSCGSKVTYVDPATNEEKTLEIKETKNADEVAASLEAIAYSNTKVASSNAYTLTIKGTFANEANKSNLNVKATAEFEVKKDATINTYLDLFKAMKAFVELKVEGKVQDSADATKQTDIKESVIKAYLEDGMAYLMINIDAKVASSFGTKASLLLQTVNEKTLKLDLTSFVPNKELDADEKASINAFLQGKSDKTLKELLPDEMLKGLKEDIKELVDDSGLIISKVSGSKVTYSFNAADTTNNKNVVELTIDVSNNKVASVKVTTNAQNSSTNLEASIKYSAKVDTISNSDKEKAIDYTSLIQK